MSRKRASKSAQTRPGGRVGCHPIDFVSGWAYIVYPGLAGRLRMETPRSIEKIIFGVQALLGAPSIPPAPRPSRLAARGFLTEKLAWS